MWISSSEGSIAQSCVGSWNVAGSNIRRSKSPAASGCDELTVVRQKQSQTGGVWNQTTRYRNIGRAHGLWHSAAGTQTGMGKRLGQTVWWRNVWGFRQIVQARKCPGKMSGEFQWECLDPHIDYSQLYISVPAAESQNAAARLSAWVEGLDQWMRSHRLKLNERRQDSANLDWHWTAVSQADRQSTQTHQFG